MNAPIIDPLRGDFPEVIEEYLEHGVMKCIAFNRRDTLLAGNIRTFSYFPYVFSVLTVTEFTIYACFRELVEIGMPLIMWLSG
ncbi:hypothetical protein F8388_001614 [Cannabis sativa]|uniref:Uncharacterized protein n=1 Tax=Cannabis sativa TaxID=3483 RepID=A0A7J6E966_CANSA|nr:hypothetical protein G4B88_030927 [Cannabis sativa]KAF4395227.1 hypothetical protein F8388_001614 [Cannabis sativa]